MKNVGEKQHMAQDILRTRRLCSDCNSGSWICKRALNITMQNQVYCVLFDRIDKRYQVIDILGFIDMDSFILERFGTDLVAPGEDSVGCRVKVLTLSDNLLKGEYVALAAPMLLSADKCIRIPLDSAKSLKSLGIAFVGTDRAGNEIHVQISDRDAHMFRSLLIEGALYEINGFRKRRSHC
ncbi:hypothetical protein CCACVL1_02071 [Corchorus capsularis]|uniref:Nucleic acid-binding protein n=1 Tax=Corchorus capsularis TaxID=210143 RepID=A0A1R3KD63_COCAP|nr:hypothetical protein CCACVL1_02071 [Corchorus capsularis]